MDGCIGVLYVLKHGDNISNSKIESVALLCNRCLTADNCLLQLSFDQKDQDF